MKEKFIFCHVERCAGRTCTHSVLKKIYKKNEINLSSADELHICNSLMFGTPKKFFWMDKDRIDKLTVIGGHFLASKFLYLKRPYVTFLRDPVNRTISNYYVWKRSSKRVFKPGCKKPGKMNREIMHMLKDGLDIVEFSRLFANHMSYMIDIDLKHFKFIGITENFDQDIYKFGRMFNVTIPKRIPRIHVQQYEDPGKKIRAEIAKNMKEDYQLYYKAIEINRSYK